MKYILILTIFSGMVFLMADRSIAENTESPVVLELFTSQSCSSCPSADKIFSELAENKNVIALGCHVTYWNHLSWQDTLSREFCTERQRSYAAERNTGRVFTPELLVNGRDSMVGSNKGSAQAALRKNAGILKTVQIARNSNRNLKAHLPSMPGKIGVINIVKFGSAHKEAIKSGENGGRTINYTNPVRFIKVLESGWDGNAQTIDINAEKGENIAVLIQEGASGTGPIIAAGQYKP
jgi:hypothetical protein